MKGGTEGHLLDFFGEVDNFFLLVCRSLSGGNSSYVHFLFSLLYYGAISGFVRGKTALSPKKNSKFVVFERQAPTEIHSQWIHTVYFQQKFQISPSTLPTTLEKAPNKAVTPSLRLRHQAFFASSFIYSLMLCVLHLLSSFFFFVVFCG
jgi:hypothetical protein